MIDRQNTFPIESPGDSALPAKTGRPDALTRREREILSLIAQGRANKEIAEQLSISVRTVEAHRAKVMRKLGLHSHAGLIHYAMQRNIAALPDSDV